MAGYVVRRLLRALLTIFGVLTIAFVVLRLNGDPGALMLPSTASNADIAAFNHAYGFDRPLQVQYLSFLEGAVHGDFGRSINQGAPAMQLVLERMPATIQLALTAFLLGSGLAFLFSILIELTGSNRLRMALIWTGVARQAIPTFLFGVLLVLLFSVRLGWFPSLGGGSIDHLVLPSLTIATFEITLYERLLDSAFGEQRDQDYVRTALAKGQTQAKVVLQHMLPNAVLPVLTVAGLNFGQLLAGAVVIETVFNWPGVGQLVIQSVKLKDFPVVEAALFVVAVVFVTINFAVDLIYTRLDPRVRLG
jgi:peptide/nickel transport system permease protein